MMLKFMDFGISILLKTFSRGIFCREVPRASQVDIELSESVSRVALKQLEAVRSHAGSCGTIGNEIEPIDELSSLQIEKAMRYVEPLHVDTSARCSNFSIRGKLRDSISSGKSSKKKVKFAPQVTIVKIPQLDEYSKSERGDFWWSREDEKIARQKVSLIAELEEVFLALNVDA